MESFSRGFRPDGDEVSELAELLGFGAASLLFAFSVTNTVAAVRYIWRRTASREALEPGVLPFFFFLTLFCATAAFWTPWVFVFCHWTAAWKAKWLLGVLLASNTLFWSSTGTLMVVKRFERVGPWLQTSFFGVYLVLLAVPIVLSSNFIPL